ncbi:hypothetical protein [Gorillibacterium sp. sgz5001074]|uniref:hypothetical protein n=1 Tax=Gorillibacterium sp. sgz5001074 TaxID=3446695 RepID=UPI003F661CF9
MNRGNEETLAGLKLEFETFNAATSASAGMTPMQSQTDIIQEDLAGDLANAERLPEGGHDPSRME